MAGGNSDIGRDWAVSGLMPLCGSPDGPPLVGPGMLPTCARGALLALRTIAERDVLPGVDGARLLAERAGMLGLKRRGRVSANGTCELIEAQDGWIALNLARDEDRALLPAWLQAQPERLHEQIAARDRSVLLERGRLLGLPISGLDECEAARWVSVMRYRDASEHFVTTPLVVDLSALWAGPLCTHLLERAGARVIKVESAARPDASREATPAFFDLLNAGKESVVLDLATDRGIEQLRCLLTRADVVVESSRPRALAQMGIDARAMLRTAPGLTWLSITGYGRQPEFANRVAFGDDAAVAAGVVAAGPTFCGDAISDPLTGLHAAVAALTQMHKGGGVLIDISLAGVASFCRQAASAPGAVSDPIAQPGARPVDRAARDFGADTQRVLREFACS